MAEFRIKKTADGKAVTYDGPFGPIEIVYGKGPDLTLSLTGADVPAASLNLGPRDRLLRRFYDTREDPYVARVGDADVMIRNERANCLPAIGRNPILAAQSPDRRLILAMKEFRAWRVRRADGSVVAILPRKKTGSIDDHSDSLDLVVVLLLRQTAILYDRLVIDASIAVGAAVG